MGNNVTSTNQAHAFIGFQSQSLTQQFTNPRASRVHNHFRRDFVSNLGLLIQQRNNPMVRLSAGRNHLGTRHDRCATLLCILRIQCHKPRIFDPAIGIFKCFHEQLFQRTSLLCGAQIQRFRRGQNLSATHVVIQKQTQSN